MMWAIYFLGIVDNFGLLAAVSALVCAAATVTAAIFLVGAISTCGADTEDAKLWGRWLRRMLVALVTSSILFLAVPNSRTVAAMYVVPAIVNNEQLQGIAGNSLKALEKLTQKWLKDLAEEAEHI